MIHRTLLITHLFPPRVGGAEQYLNQLTRGLPADQLLVVAPPTTGDHHYDRTTPFRVIRRDLHRGWLRPGWLTHLPWLLRTLHRHRITRVVFGHYAGSTALGFLTSWLLGISYVVAVFGLDFYAYRATRVRRTLLRLVLRRAEWVVANSTFTATVIRDFGLPDGKVVVSFPGVDLPPPVPNRQLTAFRQAHHLTTGPVLVTVARLVKRKGHARVMQALPAVLRQLPNMRYLIVGDGPERSSLERLASQLAVENAVVFVGAVSADVRATVYQLADAFIMLPSASPADVEGFGMVYLEALAAGRPIIATRSGGVVDIVRHEVNGLALDEPASTASVSQAIIRLLGEHQLARRLGQQGQRDVAHRFSVDQQVAVFRTILQKPRSAPADPPTVSVVVPVYNSRPTLARTLHSLILQTWRDIEVVVVDDGSVDDPIKITRLFPSVRLFQQAHVGAAATRNFGFRQSTGRFVLFCDADVVLRPRMIERMVTTLQLKPAAAYAYCSFRFGWRTFDLFDFDAARLKQSNYISTMSLIRRQTFPGFDESLTRLQDWDLWLTMLERGHRGVWVPARLFSASVGKQGISRQISAPPAATVERIKRKHHLP